MGRPRHVGVMVRKENKKRKEKIEERKKERKKARIVINNNVDWNGPKRQLCW